jgi:hypothetical protein
MGADQWLIGRRVIPRLINMQQGQATPIPVLGMPEVSYLQSVISKEPPTLDPQFEHVMAAMGYGLDDVDTGSVAVEIELAQWRKNGPAHAWLMKTLEIEKHRNSEPVAITAQHLMDLADTASEVLKHAKPGEVTHHEATIPQVRMDQLGNTVVVGPPQATHSFEVIWDDDGEAARTLFPDVPIGYHYPPVDYGGGYIADVTDTIQGCIRTLMWLKDNIAPGVTLWYKAWY